MFCFSFFSFFWIHQSELLGPTSPNPDHGFCEWPIKIQIPSNKAYKCPFLLFSIFGEHSKSYSGVE